MFQTSIELEDWDKTRDRIIDRALIAIGIIGVFGCLASLGRIPITGFQPTMIVHVGCALMTCFIALARHKFTLKFKANTLLSMIVGIGLTGIVNWGLVGNSLLWLAMGGMIVTVTYGRLWGSAYAVCVGAVTILMGWLFLSGRISLPIDVTTYVGTTASWAASLADIGIMMMLLVILIGGVHDSAKRLIESLAEKNRQIAGLADTDTLTGLVNVRVANDRLVHSLELAKRHNEKIAVLFLDLDGFKAINDQHGHAAGDAVLKTVATRLLSVVRDSDTVARIGGDEFLIIQEIRLEDSNAKFSVSRIKREIRQAIPVGDHSYTVDTSVGTAIVDPKKSNLQVHALAKSLIKEADAAMYVEKHRHHEATASLLAISANN